MCASTKNQAGDLTSLPSLGGHVNIEHMPPPTRFLQAAGLSALIWGTTDADPEQRIRQADRGSIYELAASIHASTSGVYFLLMYDETSQQGAFFVDLFSCKKVFYCRRDRILHFSTRLDRLVKGGAANPAVDVATLATSLMYDYVPTNHTLVKDVKSVRAFTIYHLHDGVVGETRRWPFRGPSTAISYQGAVRESFERLEDAFVSGAKGFDSLVVPLSGGRDSRLLLGLALKHGQHKISTFTLGQPGSLDFEIGTGLAQRLGLDSRACAIGDGFYEHHIVPSTPFMNGLTNHFLAPSDFLSGQFRSAAGQAVLSGYIGDLVFGWKKGSISVLQHDGVRYPAPKQLSLNAALELVPGAREPLLERLAELQEGLDDCCVNDQIPLEDWYYRIRVTAFTTVGLFSEEDEGFGFLTPFVNLSLLDWMLSIPRDIKEAPSFYRDLVALDHEIASLFRFPLKNTKGAGYFSGRMVRGLSTARYARAAWRHKVRPMQNFANYERMYPREFVTDQLFKGSCVRDLFCPDRGSSVLEGLDYAQTALLLSLRLHLENLFGRI
jgi:hypothetical protein